jgi:hypothetical protein
LIQLASFEMNICLVDVEAMDAHHISQSAEYVSSWAMENRVGSGTLEINLHFVKTLRVSRGTPYVWAMVG